MHLGERRPVQGLRLQEVNLRRPFARHVCTYCSTSVSDSSPDSCHPHHHHRATPPPALLALTTPTRDSLDAKATTFPPLAQISALALQQRPPLLVSSDLLPAFSCWFWDDLQLRFTIPACATHCSISDRRG
jgi:hypothetical protein